MDIKKEIENCLISCIVSRKDGVPLHELNKDFKILTGYSIPFLSLGHSDLFSYLSTIDNLYFLKDNCNNDVVIVDSKKSQYIKNLVEKQKPLKRKHDFDKSELSDFNFTPSSIKSSLSSQKKSFFAPKRRKQVILKKSMEYLSPIMYGYQIMGDDIFLKIAEKYLMVTINKTAPKRCGFCISGQTIQDLTENIELQQILPNKVAILIGLSDILNGKRSDEIINDMGELLWELQYHNIDVTLFTLPKLKCIPKRCYTTLTAFNNYIISQQIVQENISVVHLEEINTWIKVENQSVRNINVLLQEYEQFFIFSVLQKHLSFMSYAEE